MLFQILVLIINVVLVLCENVTDNSYKLIIDNDAGGDDAMAIFLALLNEKHYNGPKLIALTTGNGNTIEDNVCINNQRILKVANDDVDVTVYPRLHYSRIYCPKLIALTTGNGNTIEDNVCINNQRILKVAKRQDIPIYRGSKESIVTTPSVTDYYGKDGLGDSGEIITDLVPPQNQSALSALIELSKTYKDQLVVITLGTLTNIALALKTDPDFINRLAHLYVGAGHIHSDSNPDAEFNAHMDVEAYHVVAQYAQPNKVTFLPFSQVQEHLNYSLTWRKEVLGAIQTDIIKAQNKYEQVSLGKEEQWQALDPATVAVAVKPDLVDEYKYTKNNIILCGSKRGINSNEFVDKEDANARLVYSLNKDEYTKFLLDIFALE